MNNEKVGHWKWYFADGGVEMEGNFEHDVQVGEWTYWYANGNKQYWGNYENGKMKFLKDIPEKIK